MIKVEPNQVDIKRYRATLGAIKKNTEPVVYRAINKSIGINRTFSIDKAYAYLNLTKTYIRTKYKAKSGKWLELKAGPGRLYGQYWHTGKPIGLINFIGTRELKNGFVSVKVLRQGKRRQLRHAFIKSIKGVPNVWQRKPSARGGRTPTRTRQQYAAIMPYLAEKYRLPIERVEGPRLQDIFSGSVLSEVEKHAVETFQRKLDEQLVYELNRA